MMCEFTEDEKVLEGISKEASFNILDMFEDLLEKHNITIPDEDRVGDDGEARLYGMTYGELESDIMDVVDTACRKYYLANLLGQFEYELAEEFSQEIEGVAFRIQKWAERLQTSEGIKKAQVYVTEKKKYLDEFGGYLEVTINPVVISALLDTL